MRKITRIDALMQASEAVQEKDFVRANKILEIVDRSIAKDKANKTYSTEIELSREEKKYFKFNKQKNGT